MLARRPVGRTSETPRRVSRRRLRATRRRARRCHPRWGSAGRSRRCPLSSNSCGPSSAASNPRAAMRSLTFLAAVVAWPRSFSDSALPALFIVATRVPDQAHRVPRQDCTDQPVEGCATGTLWHMPRVSGELAVPQAGLRAAFLRWCAPCFARRDGPEAFPNCAAARPIRRDRGDSWRVPRGVRRERDPGRWGPQRGADSSPSRHGGTARKPAPGMSGREAAERRAVRSGRDRLRLRPLLRGALHVRGDLPGRRLVRCADELQSAADRTAHTASSVPSGRAQWRRTLLRQPKLRLRRLPREPDADCGLYRRPV